MTCNQLVVLLKLYRDGEADGEPQVEVIVRQLKELGIIRRAFIDNTRVIRCVEGDKWIATEAGYEMVTKILGTYHLPRPE